MNSTKPLLFLIGLLAIQATAFTADVSSPGNHWTGDLGFALSKTAGNSDTTSLSLTANANKKLSEILVWSNSATYLLGKSSGIKTAESLAMISHLDWRHSARLFSFYEMQALH